MEFSARISALDGRQLNSGLASTVAIKVPPPLGSVYMPSPTAMAVGSVILCTVSTPAGREDIADTPPDILMSVLVIVVQELITSNPLGPLPVPATA